jgi:hypothetical protein
MTAQIADYPDISDVLERKKRGRERLAALLQQKSQDPQGDARA